MFPGYLVAATETFVVLDGYSWIMTAGHGVLWSWFEAIAEALAAGDDIRITKLWEAGLTASIRLRVTRDPDQVVVDNHVHAETMRSTHKVDSTDIHDFIQKFIPNVTVQRRHDSGTISRSCQECRSAVPG